MTNPYEDLDFLGFGVVEQGVVLNQISFHSTPNAAVFGILPMVTSGQGPVIELPPNSKTQSFDLDSLYFACFLNNENDVTQQAIGCTIQVTGSSINPNNPAVLLGCGALTTNLDAAMKQATFTTFKDLVNVTFAITSPASPENLAFGAFIDDVSGTTYETCCP